MLVLEGKSPNRSVSQMGSRKVGFWPMKDDVYIQSRQSADLFNFRTKIKTILMLMRELLFSDDSALVAHSAEETQKIVDVFFRCVEEVRSED